MCKTKIETWLRHKYAYQHSDNHNLVVQIVIQPKFIIPGFEKPSKFKYPNFNIPTKSEIIESHLHNIY